MLNIIRGRPTMERLLCTSRMLLKRAGDVTSKSVFGKCSGSGSVISKPPPRQENSNHMKMESTDSTTNHNLSMFIPPDEVLEDDAGVCFRGQWDANGVYVYQAFQPEIAEWALHHGTFGGPQWKTTRMTWIKPSFAWMLYRSGYGSKPGQTKVLKIKLSHESIAHILSNCKCVDTNRETRMKNPMNGVNGTGRVQWDPERDLFEAVKKEPRRMLRLRAIQIGLDKSLSDYYVKHILNIEDVTDLSHQVAIAHKARDVGAAMEELKPILPQEQPYLPSLPEAKLRELAMLPGPTAEVVKNIGRGRVGNSL